jgi:phosphoglycerol transferase MdoB-like AlkP superfamily enzyme
MPPNLALISLVIWILSLVGIALYGGYSESAKNFCTGPAESISEYIGPDGSVVWWLQRYALVSLFLSIVTPVCVFLFQKWETETVENEEDENKAPSSVTVISFFVFIIIVAAFILDAIFILAYVPDACKNNQLGDNTCFVIMIIVVVGTTLLFCGFCSLYRKSTF